MEKTFKEFHNKKHCNVDANELQVGDAVENINDECKHYRSKGIVVKMIDVPQDGDKSAGNVCAYKVMNSSDDYNPRDINGKFKKGDILKKTEIQLKKLNDS